MKFSYELYNMAGTKIHDFDSDWIFSTGDKIFLQLSGTKRNFRIIRITHDIETFNNNKHIIRLYVEEGRVY